MFSSRLVRVLAGSPLLVLGLAVSLPAESPANLPARPEFGTFDRILYSVGRSEFTPQDSALTYSDDLVGRFSTIGLPAFFIATPHVPSGVLLTYLELDYCDTSSGNVSLLLDDCSFVGACSNLGFVDSDTGPSGCAYVSVDLTPLAYTTNNNTRRLVLRAHTSSGTSSTKLVGAYIGYKLQVSAAPASATFSDVPTNHPYFRFVEALYRAGITGGCGGGNYCVNAPITRGEMAVFLAAALGLHFPN
jgi:hypothetical protein